MRKRNKLYKVNKWNQPLFAQGIDREHQNIFDGLDFSYLNNVDAGSFGSLNKTIDPSKITSSQMSSWLPKHVDVPVGKLGGAGKIGNVVGALGDVVGGAANRIISGGLNSGAGNAVSGIGSAVGSAISTVNPLIGGAVKIGTGIIGGGINALFGMKTDQKKLQAANEGTNYLNSFVSDASTFDDIQGPNAVANVQNAYKGGLFKKGKARRKNAALRAERANAESWANRSVDNNIDNIAETQMDTMLANYAAFGGPLGGMPSLGTGAIDYDFMSNYLVTKNKAAEAKNKIATNVFGNLPVTPLSTFALGGDMQTNGGDFSNGLAHIDAGGSHEENPYDGVQVGISRENGQPNLVEEGETIFDDYVFSKRIKADAKTKKKFHIGKNADISYADLSKKLEKESLERPNDPISQNGLKKQLHNLADEQERQKGEEIQDAFEQLPPEQQQAIMQQVAMQEQQAQEAQQMQNEEQLQNAQQEEQLQGQQDNGEQIEEEPNVEEGNMEQINACGGKMNRFDNGGDMKRKIYNLLKTPTDREFDKWAEKHNIGKIDDWKNILKNKSFIDALGKDNPMLGDALSRGYDFGAYIPTKNGKLTFDFTHGGWGKEDYDAWNGSTDAAWKEAVKKGLVKKGMKSEEIGKALSQTDAYKRGSNWLKENEENRLFYLQQILNSKDAPEAAKQYAARYVDNNGWLKDVKRDYQTIFEDPNGTGVRNTHPGTYWKTPNEMLRNKMSGNFVVNDDGTVDEIIGDVPEGWNGTGSYKWQDADSDYEYNYYKRPVDSVVTPDKKGKVEDEEYEPVHKPTWGRTAGLLGPAIGLGMQALGIGKPDYSGMDAALEIANGSPALAHAQFIGNRLKYRPMDIWYEQNRMDANSRATDRAILNNASPMGTKMAGLLANGYNSQIADGELYRKALEYNDAQRQRVAEFNRGTDMYNANAANQVSATNAQIANNNRQLRAQMKMDAARQRMAADAAWNQGIYGNVNGLFAGLGAWGKENAQHNMIADMAADGLFGTMSDKQNIGKSYIRKKKAACGGKISRKKKGLTF
jgi:hypothetical protein